MMTITTSLSSPALDLLSPLTVVCHDAGAANLLFAWLRSWINPDNANAPELRVVVSGPAENLWRENPIQNAQLFTQIDAAMDGAKTVLTGTGWATEIEHQARMMAAAKGIPSIAVIDHWVNYQERFIRNGVTVLPEKIWVADKYAAALATACFPDLKIIQHENLYLQQMVQQISPVSENENSILYVLEPIKNDWGRIGPGEFQALDFFSSKIKHVSGNRACKLKLRPHPSDPQGKYNDWIADHAYLNAQLDQSASLAEAISQAKWVVGAETFALVVALAAGRQVMSTLPPWANPCRLPYTEINHLRDFE